MKIKTSELNGSALDWAVAQCEHEPVVFDGRTLKFPPAQFSDEGWYKPSEDWDQGGPIIERQEIELLKWGLEGWGAKDTNYQFLNTPDERDTFAEGHGPTPLIAAMRCYVASKLGDKVEVPDELVKE